MIVPTATDEERLTLIAYLSSKIGVTPGSLVGQMPFEIVAVTRLGKPVGAVLYVNYRGNSIEMACAGEAGWLTPGNLRSIFSYPFHQLNCNVVLSMVTRANEKARKFNRELGFRELCMIPSGTSKDGDTLLHMMTKAECKWLRQVRQPAAPTPRHAEHNGEHAYGR